MNCLRRHGVLAVLLLLVPVLMQSASAQGPGGEDGGRGRDRGGRIGFGGPGGFGGRGGGGISGEIRNSATAEELGITDEQKAKLDELSEARRAARDSNPKMQELFGRMRDATDEERQLLQVELQLEMAKQQTEADEQVKQVLGEEKFSRLRQISYHRQGAGALAQESVAKDLGLSQAQRDQLAKLQEEQRAAMFSSGVFRASPEERAKFNEEWNTKFNAVLTGDQQTKWKGLLGAPPKDVVTAAATTSGAASPAGATGPARAMIAIEAPPGVTPEVSFGTNAKGTQKLKFAFRYAPWMDVLKLFAESANLSLDLNAVPPGTFSYFDTKEYTPTEALDVLNGYLLPKGFVLVRRDEFLVCVSIDEEIAPNLIPVIGAEELINRGKNELLTAVFPLEGVDVGQIAKEIEQVKGPQGKVVGLQSTNSIMVTDIGTNLRRIQTMLAGATRGGPNDLIFKPYSMQHLTAIDAETILRGLLGLSVGISNVSAGGGYDSRSRDPRSAPPPPTTPSSSRTGGKSFAQLTADPRTNSLLVSATAAEHTLIEQALKTIDVEAEGSLSSGRPFHRVYRVIASDAREVTKTIDAIMPGIVVNEDGQNRSISIMATEQQHVEVEALIRQIDGNGATSEVLVYPLTKMDPLTAVSTLQQMFISDGDRAPTVQADTYGRQVMVRGSADQVAQVKTLLTQLGEDGTGRRTGGDTGRLRRYPMSGRDPEELLPLLERMWGTASPNPIRIVTPKERNAGETQSSTGPIRSIVRPEKSEAEKPAAPAAIEATESPEPPATEADPPAKSEPSVQSPRRTPVRTAALQAVAVQETAEEAEVAPAAPAAKAASEVSPPVIVTIMGDELLLTSNDPAALDQMEELLSQVMEVLPPRIEWTIFPLESADATEVATMLEQLFPDSSVSSTSSSSGMGMMGSGMSSFGSSLMGMTGLGNMSASPQTLQIIPDVRLNALFVSGPITKVRDVQEMLRVLDATDLGESARNKTSRMVQLEYADAQEVHDVLRETYKGYLEDGNNPQANALAMLMGGGRGGGNNQNQKPKAQLSLSVDKRTNQIIVWGDETLFKEIESLAKSLDKAAQDAKRTVRVMPLTNTNSSVMTTALGQLMPKVKVSTSGGRSSSSSSNSNSGGSSAPAAPPTSSRNDDQAREQMRDILRQQMQQQQGGDSGGDRGSRGGNPFGGGSPFGGGNPFGGGRGSRGR